MGQFGGQDTKTSQEQKLWKIGKLGIFGKTFKKGHYKIRVRDGGRKVDINIDGGDII